ncbi:VIT domain-containing protein, partial [Acidobacteriota bacterium]
MCRIHLKGNKPIITFRFVEVIMAAALLHAFLFGILPTPVHALEENGDEEVEYNSRWNRPPLGDFNEIGTGELLWKTEGGYVPLPVMDMDIRLVVTGMMIQGTVTQMFTNVSSDVIEAVYVFPLPDRAAVNYMEMVIGNRRIVSVVKEREEARKTYEKAKREGKKAALLDQERPNLFTNSVANINPGESVVVTLAYIDEVTYRDGTFSLMFPLTFTPRYVPDVTAERIDESGFAVPVSSTVRDADRISPPSVDSTDSRAPMANISVEINAGVPVENVVCTSHIVRSLFDDIIWLVQPVSDEIVADRDFKVEWKPEKNHEPVAALFTEETDDGCYALMMLVPPALDDSEPVVLPTET